MITLAFEVGMNVFNNKEILDVIDLFIDLAFGCDIIITFCTAIIDERV